ncbi:type II secretion system protein [Hydrogenimonas sp. SS33]|uniref:pilus assembly FimT family protein n=1 Tax=Hydrogenimonas leucolamina TaxID=2954236 RepID=UPI00336BB280
MKKAFTMLELIMVIVVVGILTAIMIPRFSDDKLREAADQIISHIRYTQHLAMIDDRFNPKEQNWYKERWQIGFWQCANGDWYYIVGHDLDHGGGIGNEESAHNPSDGKRLFVDNACNPSSDQSSEILITEKFGINNITFSNGCGNNKYIAFDHIGRPYKSTLGAGMYDLVSQSCQIKFAANDGDFNITIEPETGYIHLTSINY